MMNKIKETFFLKLGKTVKSEFIKWIAVALIACTAGTILAFIKVPANVKEIKIAQESNKLEHKIILNKLDTLKNNKLDKSDYKEDVRKLELKIDKIDERVYEIWKNNKK